MEFRDYYETLGVERSASDDEIKRAYRRLARKYHPDVSKEADAENRFKDMKEAYEVLKDPKKRAAYDQFGENWKTGQDFKPPPDWDKGFNYDSQDFGADDARDQGFSDFFDELFRASRSAGASSAQRGPHQQGRHEMRIDGENVNARITISIKDAYSGATRQVSFDVSEPDNQGRVVRKRRKLNVSIPKGVKAGQRIRLEGQGGPGFGSKARPGDLYLEIEFEPDSIFEAWGRDIYVTLPISPAEAALGRTVKAPTLGGEVDLKIPAGSSSGKSLRLRGRGLPGSPPGDQLAVLSIVVPAQLNAKTRELYEQLEEVEQAVSFNPRVGLEV